ncbi:leucine-rich repeat domain-containing protein [Amaricoccus tamworthensis]|uniref:leucine-rich repeat domain-containing protein n=1 Tax=Amaricoccus tamworthensis TaxID=57002 RepID=UPI003C79EB99
MSLASSSKAQRAYETAVRLIRDAVDTDSEFLDIGGDRMNGNHIFCDLEEIPSEILGLDSLRILNLRDTRISDLSVLNDLQQLSVLNLGGSKLSDLSSISGLKQIRSLELDHSQVSDLSPLANLTKLNELNLKGLAVSNIDHLDSLVQLKNLNLNSAIIDSLEDLPFLKELTNLDIGSTQIDELGPIVKLENLRYLNADSTKVYNIDPISDLKSIKFIRFGSTYVENIDSLSSLENVSSIEFNSTRVANITALSEMRKLKKAHMAFTDVEDLTPLAGLTELKSLAIAGTKVANIEVLSGLKSLSDLSIQETKIKDITVLSGLTNLTALRIDSSGVEDLTPLKDLSSLIPTQDSGHYDGLFFSRCEACKRDPAGLGELAKIFDSSERTHKTLEYLQTFASTTEYTSGIPAAPSQDDVLEVSPNPQEGGRLDVLKTSPSPDEVSGDLKHVLYFRLLDRLADLCSATGNQHYQITRRVRKFLDRLPDQLESADLVEVYLELDWLRGIYEHRDLANENGPFSISVISTLHEINTLGPGLVLGNSEIEKLEERRIKFTQKALSSELDQAQILLSESIARESDLFGSTLRRYENAVSDTQTPFGPRQTLVQRLLNRNVLIASGMSIVGISGSGVLQGTSYDIAQWLVHNRHLVTDAAIPYGEAFLHWFSFVIQRAQELTALAQSSQVLSNKIRK